MFIVAIESSVEREPTESPFNNPTFGEDFEARIVAFDHFNEVAEHRVSPINATFFVAAINKYFEQMG